MELGPWMVMNIEVEFGAAYVLVYLAAESLLVKKFLKKKEHMPASKFLLSMFITSMAPVSMGIVR